MGQSGAAGHCFKQDNDTYQAQYQAQQANVQALEKAVAAAKSNIAASQANLNRLDRTEEYQYVRAPFAGVITLRNIDAGTLITEAHAVVPHRADRPPADLRQRAAGGRRRHPCGPDRRACRSRELPGREFIGTVTRTANALDPATRTLLTEVQVANPDGKLLPGMYAQVGSRPFSANPSLIIPGDTLLIRPDGPQVAVVDGEGTSTSRRSARPRLRQQDRSLERPAPGQRLVVNPGDTVREGVKVNPKQ